LWLIETKTFVKAEMSSVTKTYSELTAEFPRKQVKRFKKI